MDTSFIQFLTTQVGLAGLAAMALWLNARSYQDAMRREQSYSEAQREDKKALLEVIRDITRALTALEAAVEVNNGHANNERRANAKSSN